MKSLTLTSRTLPILLWIVGTIVSPCAQELDPHLKRAIDLHVGAAGQKIDEAAAGQSLLRANADDPFVKMWLARCHFSGRMGFTIDLKTADKLARESIRHIQVFARGGSSEASHLFGSVLSVGLGGMTNEVEAVKWWREAANKGYAPSQVNLGWAYLNGTGVTQDATEAVKWWRMAAEQGVARALTPLGEAYWNGKGVQENKSESVKFLRKAAEQNEPKAQQMIGLAYSHGKGVAKDLVEAAKWWRLAAEQGNSIAQKDLGLLYLFGMGVTKDPLQARIWLQKAAEQGDRTAQGALGEIYRTGTGVAVDPAFAAKWYRLSGDQGYSIAQAALGRAYAVGNGVPKDATESEKWFRLAAAQGEKSAVEAVKVIEQARASHLDPHLAKALDLYRGFGGRMDEQAAKESLLKADVNDPLVILWLARCRYYGEMQFEKEDSFGNAHGRMAERILPTVRKLAEEGSSEACYLVGFSLDTGFGGLFFKIKTDAPPSDWFRKAADQGHAAAEYEIARLFENGKGVAKNETEAVKWYKKAADHRLPQACGRFGILLYEGRGVARNEAEGILWMRKGADAGESDSMYNLSVILGGENAHQNVAESTKWIHRSAEKGHSTAMHDLGVRYFTGVRVQQDKFEAMKLWRKAADAGFPEAMYKIAMCYEGGIGTEKDLKASTVWYRNAMSAALSRAKASGTAVKCGACRGKGGTSTTSFENCPKCNGHIWINDFLKCDACTGLTGIAGKKVTYNSAQCPECLGAGIK